MVGEPARDIRARWCLNRLDTYTHVPTNVRKGRRRKWDTCHGRRSLAEVTVDEARSACRTSHLDEPSLATKGPLGHTRRSEIIWFSQRHGTVATGGGAATLLRLPRTAWVLRPAASASPVQLFEDVGDVVSDGILGTVLEEGVDLADRVGGGARELDYEALAPVHHRLPRALQRGVAAQDLAHLAAETEHEHVEYRRRSAVLGSSAQSGEQQLLDQRGSSSGS